jgi:hypothetical protein
MINVENGELVERSENEDGGSIGLRDYAAAIYPKMDFFHCQHLCAGAELNKEMIVYLKLENTKIGQ